MIPKPLVDRGPRIVVRDRGQRAVDIAIADTVTAVALRAELVTRLETAAP